MSNWEYGLNTGFLMIKLYLNLQIELPIDSFQSAWAPFVWGFLSIQRSPQTGNVVPLTHWGRVENMMTSSNGNISALLAICAGNSPVSGEFPAQRPETRGFDVFFDLRLNKRLSRQSWGWWLETLSCTLWRQSNEETFSNVFSSMKMSAFQFRFHWSLFLRVQLTIFQHWFR